MKFYRNTRRESELNLNRNKMERNSSKPNRYQKEEGNKKKDTHKPTYFWVSYPDEPKEDKAKSSNPDSLLDRSNRFAL